jgi:hypothetical protein
MSLVHAERSERAAELWAENSRRGEIQSPRRRARGDDMSLVHASSANAPNGGIRPPGTNCGDVGEKW